MKLMGRNLSDIKKIKNDQLTLDLLVGLLVQMLDTIENIHSAGLIHRDIKPSNFVIGRDQDSGKVYIIDFGLAKKHLENGLPLKKRNYSNFRGTI